MMKKPFLLIVLMLSVAASAFAMEKEIGGLWYNLMSNTHEAQVISSKNDNYYSGDVVIPQTVEYDGVPYQVTSIGAYAFTSCYELTSITIPEGVTDIGTGAFMSCYKLASVTIPEGVTSISFQLFWGCSALATVTIPEGVTSIGECAFTGCWGLISVVIPGSVTSIGESAFNGCSSLTSISVPNSVTTIGEYNQEIKGKTNVEIIPVSA